MISITFSIRKMFHLIKENAKLVKKLKKKKASLYGKLVSLLLRKIFHLFL